MRPARLVAGIAVVAALCCGVLFFAGCDRAQSNAVTLRFWNGFTGPDGRTMLRIVRKFNEENPDVRVRMQRMDWSVYYNKLFVAGLGGRAPEVFVVHASHIERFLRARFIRPIDDLVGGPNPLDSNDFVPQVWSAVDRNGAHYGLPLDVHLMGLFYNKTLFREAGIVDAAGNPAPPRTRDEFMAAAERLTRHSNGKQEHWGFVFTWARTNLLTLMRQWGGRAFTPDGKTCTLDTPENIEALQFCVDLVRKHRIAPPPENFNSWIGFRQGKVAMAFEGIYMLSDLQRQKDLDFGAAPLPQLGKQAATWGDSHILCLREGLDERSRNAAWRFMRYLSDHALDWAEGGQIPVRQSQLSSARFQQMYAQAEFAKGLPNVSYVEHVPFIFEYYSEFDAAIEKALRGVEPPQSALTAATKRMNETIVRYEALTARGERHD